MTSLKKLWNEEQRHHSLLLCLNCCTLPVTRLNPRTARAQQGEQDNTPTHEIS